jgi:glycine cleavage system protein P-like pyridoxal-binding family
MAGLKVVVVASAQDGSIDVDDLRPEGRAARPDSSRR